MLRIKYVQVLFTLGFFSKDRIFYINSFLSKQNYTIEKHNS